MISYLKGKVILNKSVFIILETKDVGYKVNILANSKLKEGDNIELFTHQHIREDCSNLYGFKDYNGLELFQKLISVNGVGPKAGMAIMTVSDHEKISRAIISEDISFFQAVPGIGKKVAVKIILDLKSKISGLKENDVIKKMSDGDDVIEALTSLGYKKNEIIKTIQKIPSEISSSEEKIRWFLKNSMKK